MIDRLLRWAVFVDLVLIATLITLGLLGLLPGPVCGQ